MRMPVYVLFTKADLIAGFTEFFDDLDREKRAQVWGTTFALTPGRQTVRSPPFADELRALVERLNARLFDRLQAERNADRRALIAMFPGQFASLEPALTEFLQAAFGAAPDDPAPLLRGVYFTSGTQEGTPIDRLTGTLARALGVDQTRSAEPAAGAGTQLLPRAPAEGGDLRRGAAGRPQPRRDATARWCCAPPASPSPPCWCWRRRAMLWQVAQRRPARDRRRSPRRLHGYEQTARGLPLDPVADDDLARLAPLLDQARALPHGGDEPAHGCQPCCRSATKLDASARDRVSPRAGMGAAAAADVAAGDAVARQPQPSRLPL